MRKSGPISGRCAVLRIEGSEFETWPVNVNTLLSQCHSPPGSKFSGKPDKMLGDDLAMDWHPIQGREVILLVASC